MSKVFRLFSKMSFNELKHKILEQFDKEVYDKETLKTLSEKLMQLLHNQMAMTEIEDLLPPIITLQYNNEKALTNIDNEYINLAIECCNMLNNDNEQIDKIDFVLKFVVKFQELKSKMTTKIKEFVEFIRIYCSNCNKFSRYEKERIENILFEGLPPVDLSKFRVVIEYEFSQNEIIVLSAVDTAFLKLIFARNL